MNTPARTFQGLLILCFWSLLAAVAHANTAAAAATSSDVYAQAVRIEHEVATLKQHFKVTDKAHVEAKQGDLRPRHVWANGYTVLLKLGKLRRKHGMVYISPIGIEPMLDMPPNQPWAMTQRILTEIAIFKQNLGITIQPPPPVPVSGKLPKDVYNKLNQISGELELLAGVSTSSDVYSEVKRLNEDVNLLLRYQGIFDNVPPPPRRENLQPQDSLRAVFAVLAHIQRVQRAYGMEITNFMGFDAGEKTTPDDVMGLVGLSLAELQRVKAQLGMVHRITAPAEYAEHKNPSDVVQLLGYITAKLNEIRTK